MHAEPVSTHIKTFSSGTHNRENLCGENLSADTCIRSHSIFHVETRLRHLTDVQAKIVIMQLKVPCV
ncbi:hypothetical protein HanRHA438_Chr13g0586201 [Helianthus annuus]|nr:hypothetical protein HanRHA438_Chr13g0586201 [Helianthus annuus]